MDNKTKRITLCGSTKFKKEFEAINRQLSLEGNVVYSVAFFSHADKIELTSEQKSVLDEVHKRKIDNSDGIFVLDVDGYIGHSTRNEINHAEQTGKFVAYLSNFPDLKMICDSTLFDSVQWQDIMTTAVGIEPEKESQEGCPKIIDGIPLIQQIENLVERAFLAGRSKTSWEQFKKDNNIFNP